MKRDTETKLANSLTAKTTELLPFLPYLYQDFWELGMDPATVAALIGKHVPLPEGAKILDLACGKGAVSVQLAAKLGVQVKGTDLIPDFIRYAQQKARELAVDGLCEFAVEDINQAVTRERGYDCVVFGAVGDVLGGHAQTLNKLKKTVKQGGYLLLDNYDFIDEGKWTALFEKTGLELVEAASDGDGAATVSGGTFQLIADSALGMAAIAKRANELMEQHPEKKGIFQGFLVSQKDEYDDIEGQDSSVNVTWILKRKA